MPDASAATSASRVAVRARPKRLRAMLAVIQVQTAAMPRHRQYRPQAVSNGAGMDGPATPTPPPVTSCHPSATWVTMVAKPSVVMAK